MKRIFVFFLLISCAAVSAQLDQIPGEYYTSVRGGSEYTLTLLENGTFLLHFYRKQEDEKPREINQFGRGRWTVEMVQNFSTMGFLVVFYSDSDKDIDAKHSLDLSGSKARFVSKSERNISDKEVKVRLQFIESGITGMEKLSLNKK